MNDLASPTSTSPKPTSPAPTRPYTAGDPLARLTGPSKVPCARGLPDWEQAVVLEAQLLQETSPGKGIESLRLTS